MTNNNNQESDTNKQSFIPMIFNLKDNSLFILSITTNLYIISDYYQIQYIK